MERETGIEPALVAWKATVLPLNYSRPGMPRTSKNLQDKNLPRQPSVVRAVPIFNLVEGGGFEPPKA